MLRGLLSQAGVLAFAYRVQGSNPLHEVSTDIPEPGYVQLGMLREAFEMWSVQSNMFCLDLSFETDLAQKEHASIALRRETT